MYRLASNVESFEAGDDDTPPLLPKGSARYARDSDEAEAPLRQVEEKQPQWVDKSEKAQAIMNSIRDKMGELKRYHEKALLPNFGETRKEEQHIDVLTKEITRLFKEAEQNLQNLAPEDRDTEGRVRKNVQRACATDLQKLSIEFRKQQKDYLNKVKAQKEREQGGAIGGWDLLSGGGSEEATEEDKDLGFSQSQLLQVKQSENMAQEREEEVKKIVESVNDLSQVMKDLSVLVVDQGSVLDRIDYNCEQVAASVEAGEKQLEEAETKQKNSRMLMLILCLLVSVFVMTVIVLVLKL